MRFFKMPLREGPQLCRAPLCFEPLPYLNVRGVLPPFFRARRYTEVFTQ